MAMTDHPARPSAGDPLARVYRASIAGADGPHLSDDDWVALAADEIADDRRTVLADHIAACAVCADTWRVVSEVRAGAASFDPAAPQVATGARSWALGRWAGLAAAAVVVLAVATTLRRPAEAPVSSAPDDPAPTPPVAVSPVPVTPPSPRGWAALPAAPAVTLPPALALTMRGAPADRNTFLADLGPALAPYREARYAEAARALEPLARRYADVPEVWFYLAVSRLLAGEPAASLEAFARATGSDAVGDQAAWLRIVALERAGRVDDATAALRALCGAATLAAHRAACATLTSAR